MLEAFVLGGKMMWPLALIGLGIAWLTGRTAWTLARRGNATRGRDVERNVERGLQALLFWGAMSVVLGMLGTALGWIQASRSIAAAGGAEPSLAWAGLGITLHTLTFGLLIFVVAALSWFVLRAWEGRASERERQATA